MAHDVFLSYSSLDRAAAELVLAALEARGLRCWMAPRNILAGMGYGESIIAGLEGARVLILLLSANAQASPQVGREVERAVSKGLTVLTFRIEDCGLSKEMEYFLSARHWLDAFAPPLERHLPALADSVAALLSAGVASAPAVVAPVLGVELKHYVYISDTKADRILAQVPRAMRGRLAGQLGAEAAELETSAARDERSEEARIIRVRAASLLVRSTGKVGTPDIPSDYVEGTMTMTWGPYGLGATTFPPIAYFCGSTESTVVGLGGSAKHLVGWNDPYGGVDFGSAQPDLLFHLAAETEDVRGSTLADGQAAEAKHWMEFVLLSQRALSGPEQKLEFVAKKLLHGTLEDPDWNPEERRVLLGSPLYVALAE